MTNNELPPMDEENAMEEGVPEAPLGENSGARQRRKDPNALSVISQQYDLDGDGVLDETEQKMRDMDKSGRGFMKNDDVYKMMREQLKTQQELFTMKKMFIGLGCFTIILALSNLATAWAAAILAKDTQVSGSNDLTNKANGEILNTETKTHSYDVGGGSGASGRRGLQQYTLANIFQYTITTMRAQSESTIVRTCSDGATTQHVKISNGGSDSDTIDGGNKHHYFTTLDPAGVGHTVITCPKDGSGNGDKACTSIDFSAVDHTTCPASLINHNNECCTGVFSCSDTSYTCNCENGVFACMPGGDEPQIAGGGDTGMCISDCATFDPVFQTNNICCDTSIFDASQCTDSTHACSCNANGVMECVEQVQPVVPTTSAACPATMPVVGDSCTEEGQVCQYEPFCHTTDDSSNGCSTTLNYRYTRTCEGGTWTGSDLRRKMSALPPGACTEVADPDTECN